MGVWGKSPAPRSVLLIPSLCCWHSVQWECLVLIQQQHELQHSKEEHTELSQGTREAAASWRGSWQCLQCVGSGGEHQHKGLSSGFQLICHGQHSVFVQQEEICSSEQHPSSLRVFLKCNHHQTAHLTLLLSCQEMREGGCFQSPKVLLFILKNPDEKATL